MKDITLKTQSSDSIIRCGTGAYEKYAPAAADRQCFIVTDSNVFSLYNEDMRRVFGADFKCYVLPAGESSKTHRHLIAILKAMADAELRRNGCVIAFGGGVVGDIAGLAAALYMRGVHLVQIPTTLLSQVDSSVGGKTAVDFGKVKNLIGTFYQPEEVIVDAQFLETLPPREIRCGLGEIIKYGALDRGIYEKLIGAENLASPEFLDEITYDCIRHKADVVERDEHDLNGIRKTLNLGHTTGHAFELFYRRKSHGEFVLIGMYYELYIAAQRGIVGGQYKKSLENLIRKVIKNVPAYDDIEEAAKQAKYDKKNTGGGISLVVPEAEGKCREIIVNPDEYTKLLTECRDLLREGR